MDQKLKANVGKPNNRRNICCPLGIDIYGLAVTLATTCKSVTNKQEMICSLKKFDIYVDAANNNIICMQKEIYGALNFYVLHEHGRRFNDSLFENSCSETQLSKRVFLF
jgi:hypothetical protein